MTTTRLEAFSDAVVAIIITIMVLELPRPLGDTFTALRSVYAVFLTHALSFVFLAIYWNNHHHLLHACDRVNGVIMWANMHLLFWLSLVPFVTGWMGDSRLAPVPTAAYGVVLLMAALSWMILQTAIVRHHGPGSRLAAAVGSDAKGKVSAVAYVASIGMAFVEPRASAGLFVLVASIWLIPDRRIERMEQA